MTVGQKVRRWRDALGLSERAAAERVGVSQPTWRAVENNEVKRIGLEVADRFVQALTGVLSLEDFLPRRRRHVAQHARRSASVEAAPLSSGSRQS